MKFVVIIPDGAADAPQASLGGRTPFQAARTPALDALAVMTQEAANRPDPRQRLSAKVRRKLRNG